MTREITTLTKADWNCIAVNGDYKLYDVILKNGKCYEVITASLFEEEIIIEIDGVKIL